MKQAASVALFVRRGFRQEHHPFFVVVEHMLSICAPRCVIMHSLRHLLIDKPQTECYLTQICRFLANLTILDHQSNGPAKRARLVFLVVHILLNLHSPVRQHLVFLIKTLILYKLHKLHSQREHNFVRALAEPVGKRSCNCSKSCMSPTLLL